MNSMVRVTALLCLLVALLHAPQRASAQIASDVRISEVYGGGGNGGSTWTNDFIELYNPTGHVIDMTGWSVQYASGTGSSWAVTSLTGVIPANGFYLVQQAQGTGGTTPLPIPDATGVIAMSGTNGKVALVNTITALSGTNPSTDPSVIDFVGYGTTPNGFEGTGPTGTALTNTTSAERKAKNNSTYPDSMGFGGADSLKGNGWDINQNASDFVVHGPLPNPQNTASPLETPPVLGNIAPIIGSISRSFFIGEVGGVDTIKVNVSDIDGTVSGVKLNIKVNSGTVDSSISMTLAVAPQYVAVIPASKHTAAGNLVEYWVSAIDNGSGYSTTSATPGGYFVGDAPIASIKAYTTAAVNGYGARLNGTLNVNTNLYSNGQGFIQDASNAGMQIFKSGGITQLSEGRNVKVQGSLVPFANAFELQDPNFAFVDTSLGTSALTPVTITLPITHSPQNLNEGRLVKIVGVTTTTTGTFVAATNYPYAEADLDTFTVRVESNAGANNLVSRTIIATPIDAIGILSYNNTYIRLKPRKDTDMGIAGGDGSGTAAIVPSFRFSGVSAVAETLTITGNGTNTLEAVSVTIPSTWTWNGTSYTIGGVGFGAAASAVTGTGGLADPYVITVTGAAVTNTNTGIVRVSNLTTPASLGLSTWATQTRIAAGSFANIAPQPAVNIVSGFEAVRTGNWSNSATWSNNIVPGASDNVTFTTLDSVVTIDVANAQCNNLTMTGTGTASNSGPVLRFASSGASQLTVNGNLSLSGGSGGGSGDRGGRPQLTSNGNASATLIVKHNITTSSSNSTANGNAGLNMNEGTVKLTGATADTITIGAGHRLANLEIGDGSLAKTVSTSMNVTTSTMTIRSLTVKQSSTFWIGTATNTNVLTVGSIGGGIPTLTGGITIETGASLRVQESTAGVVVANINLFGGGITNNGTLDLLSFALHPLVGCRYNVNIDSASQTIGGTAAGTFADMTVGAGQTLTLQQPVNISSPFKMTLNGTLAENTGKTVVGTILTTRNVAASSLETFGGIGLEMNTSATAPGSTVVTRVTGVASVGGSSSSILRYFDIAPTTNTGLNAIVRYFYDDTELAGQNEATFQLWKSTNLGIIWIAQGGTVTAASNQIQLSGVNDFSRWTASDAAHPLSGGSSVNLNVSIASGWNLISNPVTNPVPGDSVRQMYPTSLNAYAFEFAAGYVQRFRLANGKGYWEKFPGAISAPITGTLRTRDSVSVVSGWNIVGSISNTVDTNTIVSVPPGLRSSNWFGYTAGYIAVTQLVPGKGYWVKSTGTGKFVLANPLVAKPIEGQTSGVEVADVLNSLTITDSRGGSQTLYFGADANDAIPVAMYVMPPAPPVGAFDARFETADGGSMVQTHAAQVSGATEFAVSIQSDAYPLTITWNVNRGTASYELADGVEGRAFRSKGMGGEGSMKITNSNVNKFSVKLVGDGQLPKEFALSQNYPNPFNPTTSITYALPVDSRVTMEIYNVIGQRVRTLVSDNQPAGYHAAEWNGMGNSGQQLSSGVYFLQLSAVGNNGKTFNDIRKLMMLK